MPSSRRESGVSVLRSVKAVIILDTHNVKYTIDCFYCTCLLLTNTTVKAVKEHLIKKNRFTVKSPESDSCLSKKHPMLVCTACSFLLRFSFVVRNVDSPSRKKPEIRPSLYTDVVLFLSSSFSKTSRALDGLSGENRGSVNRLILYNTCGIYLLMFKWISLIHGAHHF